jgi:hypothetical protein
MNFMIEQDTIRLLRECDAGVKMGVASIEDVLEHVKSESLKRFLIECKDEHYKLDTEIQMLPAKYKDDGKNPNPIAKGMSWMKTNVKLSMEPSDSMIADLMTDGCNMGVKSLNKYLNQYEAADEKTKDIIRIDLFNSNKEVIADTLKRMANNEDFLQAEFAVQLPIQYMQILENSFGRDVLTIAYESSMSDIINTGLQYDDFITYKPNAITSYRQRINEVNQTLLNSIKLLLESGEDVDHASVFAMVPCIYTTKAVLRINTRDINKLTSHNNPLILELMDEIVYTLKGILNDIKKNSK